MTGDRPALVPFVGLRPFEQRDQRWFRGRAREVAALARRVRANRFTAVVGASGTGKSSLVRAGVLPALEAEGWAAIVAKPGAAPLARLAQALAAAVGDADDPLAEACRYRFDAQLRGSAFGLGAVVRQVRPEVPHLVLVIDQFEELFRYGERARDAERAGMREEGRAFVELLLEAAGDPAGRPHVVVTMRSDFFGECSAYAGLAEAVSRAPYLVPLPDRDQLEQAIRAPVAEAGAVIDDRLVQRLLLDVEEEADRLPTLQHTLRRLWERATGTPRRLRDDDYVDVGGIAGSIDRKAEALASGLRAAHPADARTLELVMKALTELDEQDRATRRPQRRSALLALVEEAVPAGGAASLDRVLTALAAEEVSFLQLGEGDDPEVDIGHEALIRSWKRLAGPDRDLRQGWLREERDDGEEWRELRRRTATRRLLSVRDWQRVRRWIEARGLGRVWASRHGGEWDAVALLRWASRTRVGVILVLWLALTAGVAGLAFTTVHYYSENSRRAVEAEQQLVETQAASIWSRLDPAGGALRPFEIAALWDLATAGRPVQDAFWRRLEAEPAERRKLHARPAEIVRAQGLGLDAARADDLRDRLLSAGAATTDWNQFLALTAAAERLGIEPAQARALLGRVIELMGQTTNPDRLQALAATAGRLVATLEPAQAGDLLERVVELIWQITDPDQLQALATTAVWLGIEQAQARELLDHVIEMMGQTIESWRLRALAAAAERLVATLEPAQARELFDRVVELMEQTDDADQFQALAATAERLVAIFEPAQARALLDRVVEMMGLAADPDQLVTLAVTAERLAPMADAAPDATSIVDALLATAATDDVAARLGALIESLLRREPPEAYVRGLVAILKYPTMGGVEATDLVLDRMRGRLRPELPAWPDGAAAGLQATLAAIREHFREEIDLASPPVRPEGFAEALERAEGR